MKTILCCLRVIVLIMVLNANVFNCYSSTIEEISLTLVHDDRGSVENPNFRSISCPFYAYVQDRDLNVYNFEPHYNINLKIINNSTGEEVYCQSVVPKYSSSISISLGNLNIGSYTLIITNDDSGYYYYGTFKI